MKAYLSGDQNYIVKLGNQSSYKAIQTEAVVEYGAIATNDYLGTFSATISGGNCLLQVNMSSSSSSTTVKVLSQEITV